MKEIQKFLAIMQLTREQPQYGYLMSGVNLRETSNLAEHHYLVSWIGMILAKLINKDKKRLDEQRIMEMCMMHDLGELFGGDVSAPLSRKFPELKVHAQEIENRNWEFIIKHTQEAGLEPWLKELWDEAEAKQSQEAIIAKIADMMETMFFLEHRSKQPSTKRDFFRKHIRPLADKLENAEARNILTEFFDAYETAIEGKNFQADAFILEE